MGAKAAIFRIMGRQKKGPEYFEGEIAKLEESLGSDSMQHIVEAHKEYDRLKLQQRKKKPLSLDQAKRWDEMEKSPAIWQLGKKLKILQKN